jgi:hypothetical protein
MLNRYLLRLFFGACIAAALTSCGDSKAGGTGEFATVFATATPPPAAVDSDVASWVDRTTGAKAPVACLSTSSTVTTPDDVTYNVMSTPYTSASTGQSSNISASDLVITRITLTLNPANSLTPALPAMFQTQYPSAGQRIPPGSTQAVTVRIASNEIKRFFRDTTGALGGQAITCSNNPIYSYFAVVSFQAVETTTNRVATITAPALVVNFSDYIDK